MIASTTYRGESAEALLEHVIASGPVVVVQASAADDFELTYVSPNCHWLFGFKPSDVVGPSDRYLRWVHPEDWAHYVSTLARALEGGAMQVELDYRLIDATGGVRWVSSVLCFETDIDRTTTNVLGYLVDVTHLRTTEAQLRENDEHLRERQRTLEAVFEASADAILMVDANAQISFASSGLWRILGSEELHGRDDIVACLGDDAAKVDAGLARLFAREVDEVVLHHKAAHATGREVMLESVARLMVTDDGQVQGAVMVSRDVTERFHLEQALRDATRFAEKANKAKSDFLSRISHELRTPLNAMLGFAQLLDMAELEEEDRDSVARILKAGDHLLDLINEVLEISRIEAGHTALTLETFAVTDVVNAALDLVGGLAADLGITLAGLDEASRGATLHADRQHVRQVLLNLLGNAIKYNRPGGRVDVSCQDDGNGRVHLLVHDTGIGIPADQLDKVFEPFERLGREGTAVQGTGIGLTLTRRLVEEMGGTLDVETVDGEGSTFIVTLPSGQPGA